MEVVQPTHSRTSPHCSVAFHPAHEHGALTVLPLHLLDIRARRKDLLAAREHDTGDAVVVHRGHEVGVEFLEERAGERVERFRAVHREDEDAAAGGAGGEDERLGLGLGHGGRAASLESGRVSVRMRVWER